MEVRPLPDEIVRYAQEEIARLRVPGAAAGVLHDGVIYAGGVGVTNIEHPLPVTAETLFQIGSTSKTFTATALMQLVEDGAWTWTPPCGRTCRRLRGFGEDSGRIRCATLVTHHAGFAGILQGHGPR